MDERQPEEGVKEADASAGDRHKEPSEVFLLKTLFAAAATLNVRRGFLFLSDRLTD